MIVPICRTSTTFIQLYNCLVAQEPLLPMEVCVVWNGPGTSPVTRWDSPIPVRVVSFSDYTGYAFACNEGVRATEGDLLLFANDDVRPFANWLACVLPWIPEGGGAVAGLVLKDDARHIDSAGGALNLFGYGINRKNGLLLSEVHLEQTVSPSIFAPGAVFLVTRDAFERTGGFDDDFGSFFEDVDLGWRLWLAGYGVTFVPNAISLHVGGASTSAMGEAWKAFLLQRNSLLTIYKNYSDATLKAVLPLALSCARAKAIWLAGTGRVRLAMAHMRALSDFRALRPRYLEKRRQVQELRRRTDQEMIGLFREPLQPAFLNALPERFLKRAAQRLESLGITVAEGSLDSQPRGRGPLHGTPAPPASRGNEH